MAVGGHLQGYKVELSSTKALLQVVSDGRATFTDEDRGLPVTIRSPPTARIGLLSWWELTDHVLVGMLHRRVDAMTFECVFLDPLIENQVVDGGMSRRRVSSRETRWYATRASDKCIVIRVGKCCYPRVKAHAAARPVQQHARQQIARSQSRRHVSLSSPRDLPSFSTLRTTESRRSRRETGIIAHS